ncbi:MAG: hypothetical protein M1835_006838 [Candelina submexicana]|nr:MAG: hypothetical protein M1835_006838 [Candelina submexicana]
MFAIIIGLITVLAGLIVVKGSQSSIHRKGKKLLKPPNTLPILGNAIIFLQARHKLFHWFAECQRQHGFRTLEISVPTLPPGVVINAPENLEFVLKHDDVFTKGDFFKSRSWDLFGDLNLFPKLLGNGIINVDGPLWKTQRKAALRFFSNSSLKTLVDVHLPMFVRETKSQLRKAAAEKRVIDLEAIFMDFTTRLMGKLAYDIDMDSSSTFFKSFDLASGAIGERFQNPLWRVTEPLFNARLRRALSEVKDFGASIVATTLEKWEYRLLHGQPSVPKSAINSDSGATQPDGYLINALIDNFKDPRLIADSALNFLSAGRDTTAQSLTWTFYLLMRHPTTIPKILTELSHLPTPPPRPPSPTPPSNPSTPQTTHTPPLLTSTTIQPTHLPYTHAVFYESLRLYPPVPFEIKQCSTPTTLPDNTYLPKDAVVVWCPWAMGRSREIWGEDAEFFNPERWLEDIVTEDDDDNEGEKRGHGVGTGKKVRLVPRSAFEFPVFNGGPRACMGKKMAELQAVYVIACLVREFEFEEVGEAVGGGEGGEGGKTVEDGDDGEAVESGEGGDGDGRKAKLKKRISRNSLTLPMEGGLPCYVRRGRGRV